LTRIWRMLLGIFWRLICIRLWLYNWTFSRKPLPQHRGLFINYGMQRLCPPGNSRHKSGIVSW
jgi:hypothetical protein